jgi:hypothetical protein
MTFTGEERKRYNRVYEKKRRSSIPRLRIALEVLREYGMLWEYERRCDDEGIEDPLSLPRRPGERP